MEKHASLFVKSVAKGAREKYNKAKRTYTCRTLKELIKAYRACTTSAEERALVKDESSHIRDLFREGDTAFRRRNIAKLLFFHMNGYPTDFGMKECIVLCGSDKFSDKRVAYLGIMILVDESRDILMLITNSLKQDLCHSDQHIIALALTVMANLASADISRDLLPEVEKHLDSANAYTRKKAALAAVRAVRKLPHDETPNVLVAVPQLFETRQSAAHIAGTSLVMALARQHGSNVPPLRASTLPALMSVLRELLMTRSRPGVASGTAGAGVKSPFMQVKLLQSLRVLARGAPPEVLDPVSDVLAQVASNTDTSRLVGTAVLYECVRTIVSLNVDTSLHTLAVSTLGGFLGHKDPNVRYVALQELMKVVSTAKNDVNIEQYRGTITECLKEADPSIKRRAIELLHAIAGPENSVEICEQLKRFLASCRDDDLKESACTKLCDLISRFSPSSEWRHDTFMRALEDVDMVMPERYVSSFVAWISSEKSVWSHAAVAAYKVALRVGSGGVAESKALTVVDPFDTDSLAGASASLGTGAGDGSEKGLNGKGRKPAQPVQSKPRLQRVCLYVLGEYGDLVLGPGKGTSTEEAMGAIERVLETNGGSGSQFPASVLSLDPEDDGFALELSLVRNTCLVALIKLAVRLSPGSGGPIELDGLLQGTSQQGAGLGGLLALTNGTETSRALVPADAGLGGGLGTDLLESLGIGDGALVEAKPVASAVVPVAFGGDLSIGGADLLGDSDSTHPFASDNGSSDAIHRRVQGILNKYCGSQNAETQQRASEFVAMLGNQLDSVRDGVFARMPPLDYATIQSKLAKESSPTYAEPHDEYNAPAPFSQDLLLLLEDDDVAVAPAPAAITSGLDDLLALPPSEASGGSSGVVGAGGAAVGALDDLLRGASPLQVVPPPASSNQGVDKIEIDQLSMAKLGISEPSVDLPAAASGESIAVGSLGTCSMFRSDALAVTVEFLRDDAGTPGEVRAEFAFENLSSETMSKFVFQLAVPRYMKTEMKPASSSELSPGGSAQQTVLLSNNLYGEKPVQLRYRLQYANGQGQDFREQGVLAPDKLPVGL